MPKIRAYSWKDSLIPVQEAKTVNAYICPWTDKIFRNKKAYLKHLASYRKVWIYPEIRKKQRDKLTNELWSLKTFDDVIDFIETHPELVFTKDKEKSWFKITYLSLTFGNVRNSHSCPHNGVQNWIGSSELPTSYPGWHGRIEFQMSPEINYSDFALAPLRIHTGTGGGRSNNRYGFDVRFFNDDWPGLSESVTMKILADDHSPTSYKKGKPDYFR